MEQVLSGGGASSGGASNGGASSGGASGGALFGFGNIYGLGRSLVQYWEKVGVPNGI